MQYSTHPNDVLIPPCGAGAAESGPIRTDGTGRGGALVRLDRRVPRPAWGVTP